LKKNIIEAIEISKDENEPVNTLFGIWELEVNSATASSH
jgi:hypothetical protein